MKPDDSYARRKAIPEAMELARAPCNMVGDVMNVPLQFDVLRLTPLKRELAFEVTCAVFRDSLHASPHVVRLEKGSADGAHKAIGGASPVLGGRSDQAFGRLKSSCRPFGELFGEFHGVAV